jgi:hypothetical protein
MINNNDDEFGMAHMDWVMAGRLQRWAASGGFGDS